MKNEDIHNIIITFKKASLMICIICWYICIFFMGETFWIHEANAFPTHPMISNEHPLHLEGRGREKDCLGKDHKVKVKGKGKWKWGQEGMDFIFFSQQTKEQKS